MKIFVLNIPAALRYSERNFIKSKQLIQFTKELVQPNINWFTKQQMHELFHFIVICKINNYPWLHNNWSSPTSAHLFDLACVVKNCNFNLLVNICSFMFQLGLPPVCTVLMTKLIDGFYKWILTDNIKECTIMIIGYEFYGIKHQGYGTYHLIILCMSFKWVLLLIPTFVSKVMN